MKQDNFLWLDETQLDQNQKQIYDNLINQYEVLDNLIFHKAELEHIIELSESYKWEKKEVNSRVLEKAKWRLEQKNTDISKEVKRFNLLIDWLIQKWINWLEDKKLITKKNEN